MKSEVDNKGNILEVDIINNNNTDSNSNLDKKFIATVNEWHGQGLGIKKIRNLKNFEYSDNNYNEDSRTPNDKLWITTISKKERAIDKKSLFNKITIDDNTADFLIRREYLDQNCIDSLSSNNKTEFLIKLSNNIENKLRRNEFEFESIENINLIVEKKDGTFISLKPMYINAEYKLNIKAINGDHVNFLSKERDLTELRNELLPFDDTTKNIDDVIENIYIFNEQDYIEYEQKHTNNLKIFNTDVVKNMVNMQDIDKIDFDKENISIFTLDSFVKDKEQFVSDLFDALSQGKKIALFPFSLNETSIKDLIFMYKYVNKEFFVELSNMLTQELKKKSDLDITNNFGIAINEILKNAFVHGNNLAVNKPIFLYMGGDEDTNEDTGRDRLYISNIVDKETKLTNYQKVAAVLANLTGVHTGNEYINIFMDQAKYTYSDIDTLKTGDIYKASIKVGNINSQENKKMAGIKDNNMPKVYELLIKGIPSSLVNIYIVLKETREIFFTPEKFKNAHEQDRQQGAKTLVKQANILKISTVVLSLSLITISIITGVLPLLVAIQIIFGAVISMFSISAATHYYINYEFINDIKDIITENKKDNNEILTVKIINKNIDEDIYVNNIKLVNSGLKVNGEIVWINKNSKELVVYCKEQNYEEILPVAKNISLRTKNIHNAADFCIDSRENTPEITEIAGIPAINSSFYNELKENKISDAEIASAIKQTNIMEQKVNTLYSVSKTTPLFLEYEINKNDDTSYNNFINEVLAENLGFGYVINIESIDDNLKDELKKAKQKGITVYIRCSNDITQEQIKEMEQYSSGYIYKNNNAVCFDKSKKDIAFTKIDNFNGIDDLENKIKTSKNTPLISASELSSLIKKERLPDKLAMLNKLAKLLFIKREYNEAYVKDLANSADEKLLKEISLQIEKNEKFDNNILEAVSQNTKVQIVFKKIETNNPEKSEKLKIMFSKTIAVRALLYTLSDGKNIKPEHIKNITNIGALFDEIIKHENNINIKDKNIKLTSIEEDNIDNIKQQIGNGNLSVEDMILLPAGEIDAITKLEYILKFLIDDNIEINREEKEFNSTMEMKALLSAA